MADDGGLVKGRATRRNAGNLMSKLIEDEQDVDDFYKTAFGGFEEESGDEEFESDQHEDDDDVVDSDFSLSETDEVIEEGEDEPKRKRKKVYIKPYRGPKEEDETKKPKEQAKPTRRQDTPRQEGTRKSTRSLTVERSEEHKKRQNEAKERRKRQKERQQKARVPQLRRLTQEELLAEAAITEEENVASLQNHQMLEASKKKTKLQKVTYKGPLIRYLSLSMPVMELKEPEVEVSLNESEEMQKPSVDSSKRCSRNFLIFTDAKNFPEAHFSVKKPKRPQKTYCPVTGLPARYRDPLTNLPYATTAAFRYIREQFVMQAEDMKVRAAEAEQKRRHKTQYQ